MQRTERARGLLRRPTSHGHLREQSATIVAAWSSDHERPHEHPVKRVGHIQSQELGKLAGLTGLISVRHDYNERIPVERSGSHLLKQMRITKNRGACEWSLTPRGSSSEELFHSVFELRIQGGDRQNRVSGHGTSRPRFRKERDANPNVARLSQGSHGI